MTREARVVKTEKGLMAEVIRSEACAQCRACQVGQKEQLLCPLPEGDYREGDTVVISIPEHALTRATFLAYGIPLICLVGGLMLGSALFKKSEILQFACAALFTFGGLMYLYLSEKKRRASRKYDCTAEKQEP